jgi:O-antigen/teichoic acid export membrane protein
MINNKVFKASLWNVFDRIFSQTIRFILNIILARILFPSDYGLIGMLAVFIAISQSFIEGGFINALIQKQNRTEKDFSTIFFFNIITSLFLYIVLFLAAPYVSEFYNEPSLKKLMRVLTISIVFSAINVVPISKLHIKLDFKKLAKVTVGSSSISSVCSIYLAYKGFGVWTLVFQNIFSVILQSIILFVIIKWKPKFVFYKSSFVDLFSFGSKILTVNLFDRLIKNLYFIIIGKYYSVDQLGFYTKAEQYSQLPSSNIAGVFKNITFPHMCEIKDNLEQLKLYYAKTIMLSCIITFPILFFISFFSESIIVYTLTEKWISASPFLKLIAISGLIYPINFLNTNLLLAKKETALYLYSEAIKKILIIVLLILTVKQGIIIIIYGQIIVAFLSLIVNFIFTNKIINYSLIKQFQDIIPFLLISFCSFYMSFILMNNFPNYIFKLIAGFVIGTVINFLLLYLTNIKDLRNIFKQLIKKSFE